MRCKQCFIHKCFMRYFNFKIKFGTLDGNIATALFQNIILRPHMHVFLCEVCSKQKSIKLLKIMIFKTNIVNKTSLISYCEVRKKLIINIQQCDTATYSWIVSSDCWCCFFFMSSVKQHSNVKFHGKSNLSSSCALCLLNAICACESDC